LSDYPATLPGLLARNKDRYAGRTALREKDLGVWGEVSWDRYYDQVKHFCLGLISLGLQRGQNVSILGDNCREWIYGDLAVQSAGAVAVGVYPTNPARQVEYIVGHSDSVMVIARDQEQVDKILEVKAGLPLVRKIIVIDMKGLRHYDDPCILPFAEVERLGRDLGRERPALFEELLSRTRPEDVALMVYTSGTTGPPKGAMLTHRNLLAIGRSFSGVLDISDRDQVVSYLPLCHIAERLLSVILALSVGYTVNFAESIDTVQESLYEISPTVFVGVPRIWEKMATAIQIRMKDATPLKQANFRIWMGMAKRISARDLAGKRIGAGYRFLHRLGHVFLYRSILDKLGLLGVRLAISGSAPISPDILKFFHALGLRICQVYGQTEGSGVSHVHLGVDRKIGSVGRTLPEVECRLLEDGEILTRSPMLFKGYYKDPQATAAIIGDGWLHSGDVGRFDGEGDLYITDRKKDILITSGGKNIAPSEMENRLKFSPYINEAIVLGDGRKYLTALIQIDLENVSKWAKEQKIAYTTFKSLVNHPEVYELIRREVQEANKEFAQVETIKRFRLLDKELDHDDDELTATLKVRRKSIETKFKDLIESMYRG